MKTIHKFRLNNPDTNTITTSRYFKPLSIQVQDRNITLWAEVEADDVHVNADHMIYCFGTGHKIPDGLTFIQTVQAGVFVWHYYYIPSSYQN